MTDSRGRKAPSPPSPYPGSSARLFTGAFPWNAPLESINPLGNDDAPARPLTPLAQQLELYRRDREATALRTEVARRAGLTKDQKRREQWIEARADQEFAREITLERHRQTRKAQRHDRDAQVLAELRAYPKFICKPVLQRIDYLRKEAKENDTGQVSAFLRDVVENALARLEAVKKRQITPIFLSAVKAERLDELLRLAELNQKEVRLQATMAAAHMDMLFEQCMATLSPDTLTPEQVLQVYQVVAGAALRLRITPPSWHALNALTRRRGESPYDLLPGALARLCCADWWYRKLWHLRCEWREEQLRAMCLVHRAAAVFVSHDALMHKREQRRRVIEFVKAHKLVNEDGVELEMADVMLASNSNPRNRRNEMMATVRGMQEVAEVRGDCAMFYTITCPSKYHAALHCGKPNPKWTTRTVRESSDYLVDLFADIRKKLARQGLRWYGVRIAEPHHDGTVHWHMLCFMRKKDRKTITAVMRQFAIREDRAELGKNIKPRFDGELITKKKGDPVSYVAAYIGKNVDSRPLRNKLDPKTGQPITSDESDKPLAETVENAIAWASLHRVRQFQFFGIPSRQAYRELRLLAGQLERQRKPKKGDKKGMPLLSDPKMDAVLAAADVGCVASYITAQGGVLIPREYHTVRTAYSLADKPNDYGEHCTQIYGVYSPRLGPDSRICTHASTWTLVRKTSDQNSDGTAGAGVDLDRQGGPTAPWTRGNNCPGDQKTAETRPKNTPPPAPECGDFEQMSQRERRQLLHRLRVAVPKTPQNPVLTDRPHMITPEMAAEMDGIARQLLTFVRKIGLEPTPCEFEALLSGAVVNFGDGHIFRLDGGRLLSMGWRALIGGNHQHIGINSRL